MYYIINTLWGSSTLFTVRSRGGYTMTAKELKKLKRSELLEMLLARTEEVERLRAELDEAQKQLDDRAITLENSGSIAEAALKLNGVFEAAEEAAKQYLENIERIALANAVEEDKDTPPETESAGDAE